MPTTVDFEGLDLLSPIPGGEAGLAFSNNFMKLGRRTRAVHLDALDFPGCYNDGIRSDYAGIQAAVDALAPVTPGTVWLDPRKVWSLDQPILIKNWRAVHIRSDMNFGGVISGESSGAIADLGFIKPIAPFTAGMFKWVRPDGNTSPYYCGGGGASGLVFYDPLNRNYIIHSALDFTEATIVFVRECHFNQLRGRAIYGDFLGSGMFCDCDTRECGDTGKPAWQMGGPTGFLFAFMRRCQIEQTYNAPYLEVGGLGTSWFYSSVNLRDCSMEAETSISAQNQTMINGLGDVQGYGLQFGRNNVTPVKLYYNQSTLTNVRMGAGPTLTDPHILVDINAYQTQLENIRIQGANQAQDVAIQINAADCVADRIKLYGCGGINCAGVTGVNLSRIKSIIPLVGASAYVLDIGSNTVDGAEIDGSFQGSPYSVCHGIRTTTGDVRNAKVHDFTGDGITATGLAALQGNRVYNVTAGREFVYAIGTKASGNTGYPNTGTIVGNPGGTVTQNGESGTLTTPALSNAPGAFYSFTVTNSLCATTSKIFQALRRGSDSQGVAVVLTIVPFGGFFAVAIQNINPAGGSNFNGTWIFDYLLSNN